MKNTPLHPVTCTAACVLRSHGNVSAPTPGMQFGSFGNVSTRKAHKNQLLRSFPVRYVPKYAPHGVILTQFFFRCWLCALGTVQRLCLISPLRCVAGIEPFHAPQQRMAVTDVVLRATYLGTRPQSVETTGAPVHVLY